MHRRLTYANSGAEKLTGYGHAELQVADSLSWAHPEDRSQVLALWDKAFDGQTTDQVVYRLIRKDGTVKWAAGSWGPVTDETGHQICIRGTCQDITERFVAEEALQETTQKFRTIVEEIAERKRAEQALRESEERTRLAMQAGRMFAFEWDPRTDEVRRSHTCADITGSSPDATREPGKESLKRVHPEDQERLSQTIKSLTPANDTYEVQYRVIRSGGQIATLQQNGRAFFDSSGVMIRLIGIIADITERKQAETALRDSEERFRVTFSQAAVGIAQTGLDGKWLLLNDRLCEILGYTQAELCGKNFLEITHPDDREASLAAVRQLLAGDISSWSTEGRYVRKEGAIVWARLCVSLVRDQDNRPQYFIAVVEDVTERVQADRALRDSERRLALAQTAARLGVWDRDLRTDTIAISGEYTSLYGLPPDRSQITHQEWLSLVHPDDRERMEALLRENRERPGDWDVEFRVVWPDRSLHWLLGKGTVLFDDFGQPVRRVGVHLDITERKRAEALLRESEQRFRDLADSAPVMIWVIGPDKRATFFNKYCLDFTGQTMDEKLGEGWIKGLHPEDRERFLGVYSSSIDARREFNSIFRVRRADGKYRWVLCTGVPRFAAAGAFSGYIGSCVDIADQKLVEEQLRANEVRLKDAQRLAKVGSWERHIANDSIYWSDEMLQILGLPNAPPVDFSSFLNYVHPRDREIIMEADRKIRSGIASLDVEYRITQPSGSVRFVRSIVEAIRNDQGAVVRIAGATQDVTEEVRARELLRESEKHLKNAERLAHLGHWQWDIWANRVSGSEEMLRILWKPQNYVPSHEQFLQDLVPQDRERVERLIRDSIEKKIGYSTEYQIALPNGELRTISCICEVLLDEEGLPARMFGTCQDVTDQRLAEVSLRQSLDEIAHLNRVAAMGELTASLAHELNQPLAAILSNAQAAIRFVGGQSPDLAQVRECLSDIVADDKRAGEVIKRLRGLLRKGQYQPSLVDLNEVVSEAVRLVGNDALLRQVSVKFEPLPGLPPVLGDRIQLYQVALNLIVNGLDASAEKPPGDRWVLVRTAEADGGRVELTVEDSGKGIAESEISRLFEPFFTTKRDGLGMGLSISRSIVQAHRGQIWAENRAGRGAIFHCVLPVAQQAAVAATL